MMQQHKGWKFDEIEDKSSSTEKRNSYSRAYAASAHRVNRTVTDYKPMYNMY
jgi:hypothetical protein